MDISGPGISTFTARVLPGFKPTTRLSLKWRELASGNWAGLDRGSAQDTYETTIGFKEKEAPINNIIDQIKANRDNGSNVITLSVFNTDTERIFGENVDHDVSISATVLSTERRRQESLNGWGLQMRIRALTPAFTGASSFPTLDCVDTGVRADSSYTINKFDSYTGVFSYHDHQSDSGIFEGIFTLTVAKMILLRNFIRTTRTGNFTLSDTFGVDFPFGTRSGNSYPFTVKLIEWEDLGFFGLLFRRIRLRFSEVN